MAQMKEKENSLEEPYEMEMNNLTYKEVNVMVIKMLTKLGIRMDKHRTSTKTNKIKKKKQNQLELKNTINEMKSKLEGNQRQIR